MELSYGAWIVVVAVEDMTGDVHAMMVYIEILCKGMMRNQPLGD